MARNHSPSPADPMMRISGSPAPQPQSKRDKRRVMLGEKLTEMVASFNANLRPHYEAQANAIQVDINLILRADPYGNTPLEDDPEEINKLIQATVAGKLQFPPDTDAEGDFVAGAGKFYTEFVHEANDSMEQRDINLTLLHNRYQNSVREMDERHMFQIQMAHEEHKILSNTVRERLMRHMTEKKMKLMKEKDQLDIGDSNAFLLHPNQFNLMNPASPSGAHKRATRNAGRKISDHDDPASIAQEHKRKRKTLFQEVENQSSTLGPSRDYELGFASPYRDVIKKRRLGYQQYEAPAYSIDRLFTEKELAMTMNTAAHAAQNFLQQRHAHGQTNSNGVNGTHVEDGAADSGNGTTNDMDIEEEAAAAPGMERMTSHHATRGATRALTGLAAVASGEMPFGMLPTFIPAALGAKANSAPVAASQLAQADIEQDLAIMCRDTRGDDPMNDGLLERAIAPAVTSEYQYQAPLRTPDYQDGPVAAMIPANLAPTGGVPMSAQSSRDGRSEIGAGGVSMSRNTSSRGVGLQRVASQTGSSFGGQEGRRVRGRLV